MLQNAALLQKYTSARPKTRGPLLS